MGDQVSCTCRYCARFCNVYRIADVIMREDEPSVVASYRGISDDKEDHQVIWHPISGHDYDRNTRGFIYLHPEYTSEAIPCEIPL